jgi:hypothetical protein
MVEDDIVVELSMNASQLRTLRWILLCWLGQYEENEGSIYKIDARAIFDALEEV